MTAITANFVESTASALKPAAAALRRGAAAIEKSGPHALGSRSAKEIQEFGASILDAQLAVQRIHPRDTHIESLAGGLQRAGSDALRHGTELAVGSSTVDQTAATIVERFRSGAQTVDDAARALNKEAYFLRASEGVGRTAPERELFVSTKGLPRTEVSEELGELLRRQAARTPERNMRTVVIGKFGDGQAWDEYVRLYGDEYGKELADDMRTLVHEAIDRSVEVSEHAKNATHVDRPFNVASDQIRTVAHRPKTLSYPSGHTARARAASRIVEAYWPERQMEARSLAEAVGESRLDGGLHWPTDVRAAHILGDRVAARVLRDRLKNPKGPLPEHIRVRVSALAAELEKSSGPAART